MLKEMAVSNHGPGRAEEKSVNPDNMRQDGAFDVVVISPHLDDAVLSVGALIARLVAEGRRVEVWTIFTHPPKSTKLAKDRRGFGDYITRRAEDERALARLGAGYRWLDFSERIWGEPSLSSAWHVFRTPPSAAFFANSQTLTQTIVSLLNDSAATVYVPLGIGNHYDHVEVAFASLKGLLECSAFDRLRFYEDVPYAFAAGCRRRHFIARQKKWRTWAAPVWASPILGWFFGYMAWSARGPGIDAYLPIVNSLDWSVSSEPVGAFESAKLESLAEYVSQVKASGGMKRIAPLIRRAHATLNGEPIWSAAPSRTAPETGQ
ncbi:MAG: PIG-L family deacetylase [Proteobacteria bacterium]|nr:PIG-L family deacetylase [Pseudomonadota bacterium]